MTPDDWITLLAPMDGWNERLLMATFALTGLPPTYLDIGSGTGAMVNFARRLGIEAFGIDQTVRDHDYLITHDLREPCDIGRKFHMVTCLEVAEHIPPTKAEILCSTIARHMELGALLIFSAACPGQGGDDHLNNQPATYWRTLFHERGVGYQIEMTPRLAHAWDLLRSPLFWLISNVQVFVKG